MRFRACTAWLILFTATSGRYALPEEPAADWLTGRDLLIQRSRPLTANWSQTPLREALSGLSRSQRVAILLDRRVDPDQPLTLAVEAVALEEAVERLAQHSQAEVSWLGPLAYLGPRRAARRLRTLAALRGADAAQRTAQRRQVFARERPWRWNDLATPRELCQELAEEADARLESLDLLPHDLWAAADLPPLSWTDRLTLLTNEFDLTFEFADGGATVRLVPIVEPVRIERRYPGGSQPAQLAKRYAQLAPEAEIARTGGKVVVVGRMEDHERLSAKPKAAPRGKPGKQVFTMRADEQPLSAVLDQLRQQLGLELAVDKTALKMAGASLDQPISFAVQRATLEELLTAILKPAGLSYRGEGGRFEIVPSAECGVRGTE